MYGFMDEREAARFLGLLSADLRRLEERGGGRRRFLASPSQSRAWPPL